ncbi:hypothetical protein GAYE_PCTG69G1419 [Galdieria yellowstonensis]|uniref:Adenosine kinase n=1 Tax=Galdieria yellowstonensis TaxID=3028027 RepID=A0AAV9I851_9RHOD|nr:hypothetical protein GAYE_PCTG69G1419 [Galdieria yellowstonensis]
MTYSIERAVEEGVILGIGNPLLDVSANVDESLLKKYGLEANSAILAEEKHLPLFQELKAHPGVEYVAGGATQNSIRVAQWMLQKKHACGYIGAIGKDDFGEQMRKCATDDGVKVHYYDEGGLPTGTCGVLVTRGGQCRSLVANLSAANTYQFEHLKRPETWKMVEKANIFYIAGFFLTVSPESAVEVGKHANLTKKTFCMNLSAPFLLQVPVFFERFKQCLPLVDIYFGNESEAATLATSMEWDTKDVKEIAIRLAQQPKETARPRIVVFTQGSEPTILVIGTPSQVWLIKEYPIIPIEASNIVDTNGAGDAFVGGFLSGLAKGLTLDDCIARGHYAANVIIQRPGCTFPEKPNFKANSV